MAKIKKPNKNDLNGLRKEIASDVEKLLTKQDTRINKLLSKQNDHNKKLLIAQDIRNWGKMAELEEKFEKHITKLKSEFLNEIDPVLKEVTTAREERPIIAQKQSDHEDRLSTLEKIHPEGKHFPATT